MPAAQHIVPRGLTDRILKHLADHPDEGFRVTEVSHALFPKAKDRSATTVKVGSALSRMRRNGQVLRVQRSVPGRVAPITTYHYAPPETDA